LLGLRFSHLVGGSQQISLFEDTESQFNLYQTMDDIRLRFGGDKIKRAASLNNF